MLISKLMTSQTRQQRITIHLLHNMERRKGNQLIKFGELIKYKIRIIFLEKSCTKYGGEAKKSKLSIVLDQQPEML